MTGLTHELCVRQLRQASREAIDGDVTITARTAASLLELVDTARIASPQAWVVVNPFRRPVERPSVVHAEAAALLDRVGGLSDGYTLMPLYALAHPPSVPWPVADLIRAGDELARAAEEMAAVQERMCGEGATMPELGDAHRVVRAAATEWTRAVLGAASMTALQDDVPALAAGGADVVGG